MSFFPTPDPERLRIAMNQQPRCSFVQAPTYPIEPFRNHPWPVNGNSSHEGTLQTPTALHWSAQDTPHLGFMTLPTATLPEHVYQDALMAAEPLNMQCPWPSEFVRSAHPAVPQTNSMEKAPAADGFDLLSTILPNETMWTSPEQIHAPSAMAHELSPSLSSYSTQSQFSMVSSSYEVIDDYVVSASEPRIKVEKPFDKKLTSCLVSPGPALFEHSLPASPESSSDIEVRSVKDRKASRSRPSGACPHSEIEFIKAEPSSPSSTKPSFDLLEERRKREFTKQENANCACKKCGKLFQRTYNLKAHMETHDPNRSQPHSCLYHGCDKKFVRRTDLLRHEHSVG